MAEWITGDRFEKIGQIANAALTRWLRVVRLLSHPSVSGDCHDDLRALVSWYERVCVDDLFASPPPASGIRALDEVKHGPGATRTGEDVLLMARDAVAVAEELVDYRRLLEYRRQLGGVNQTEPQVEELALMNLERATQSACDRLDSRTAVITPIR